MPPRKAGKVKSANKPDPKSKKIDEYFKVKQEIDVENVKFEKEKEKADEVVGSTFIVEEIEEIVEHICAKCEKTFDNMEVLRAHLPSCRRTYLNHEIANEAEIDSVEHYVVDIPTVVNSKIKLPQTSDTTVVIDFRPSSKMVGVVDDDDDDDFEDATKDEKKEWESHNDPETCYCCGESHETAHTGHIRCKKCPKSFKDNTSLRRHTLIVHSMKDKFPCDTCNAQLLSKKLLKIHKKAHEQGKQFCCKSCGKEFTRKYHLDRHLKFMNCDGTRPVIKHPCKVCGSHFARYDNLKEHLRTHIESHSQPRKDFQCPYCPKAFAGSSLLNIHIRTHTGEKPFVCDICKNGFPSNGALRKHRRTHTGEKPYQCSYCPSRFAAKETLNRHTKTHTGDKKYKCGHCDARFIQNSQLKAHMKAHDDSIRWDCKFCEKQFETVRLLHIHHRNEHKIGKIYTCDYCSQHYITKAEIKRHMEGVHIRLRQFACTECPKMFVTKGQLDIHSNIHRIESPVKCKLCRRLFRRKDCYRRHIRTRHREYFERALQMAEQKKLGQKATVYEEVSHPNEIELDADNLSYNIKMDIEENGYVELIIPEAMEDEYMEASQNTNDEGREDLEFGGLYEHITSMKVESSLTDESLLAYTKQLLGILLDKTTLDDFGYPKASVATILNDIIEHCGARAFNETDADEPTKVRENMKLFFTLVLESEQIKTLLNNHSVDEVIQYLIKYLLSDDVDVKN